MLVRNPAIKIIGKRNEREFAKGSADAPAEGRPVPNHSNQDSARVQPLELENPHRSTLASSSRTQDEASSRLEALLNTTLPISVRPKCCKNSENEKPKSFEWNLNSTTPSKLPR